MRGVLHSPGPALSWALPLLLVAACGDTIEPPTTPLDEERLRLGRVHVLVEEATSGDALDVSARFALVRGLSESFARARTAMPQMPDEWLELNECGLEELQWDADLEAEPHDSDELHELLLVDAGDMQIRLGGQRIELPLSLVPDLLPYMSGVEYSYRHTVLPLDQSTLVAVEADGSSTEALGPFSLEAELPATLGLSVGELDLSRLHEQDLDLTWSRPSGAESSDAVTLRLSAHRNGEQVGPTVACLLSDSGATRLDLTELGGLLPASADRLDVSVARVTRESFDAGTFRGSEFVIERRASLTLGTR